MRRIKFQTLNEMLEEGDALEQDLLKRALEGEARWGAWRYNPHNLTLEIDSEVSGYPKSDPYYVDLERCNTSAEVLDRLCQVLHTTWCSPEQVGYLLKAVDELAGNLQASMCSCGKDTRIDIKRRLIAIAEQPHAKLLKVNEVADRLRISKLTVYRMVKDGRLKAIRLPIGRHDELRISETEVDGMLEEANPEGKE